MRRWGGGRGGGWRGASVSDHVGDGTWTITSNIQGRELCRLDFMDTCELIFFKFVMMLDTMRLYCLTPV